MSSESGRVVSFYIITLASPAEEPRGGNHLYFLRLFHVRTPILIINIFDMSCVTTLSFSHSVETHSSSAFGGK